MSARIITQISYDAYCHECGFVVEGFDDEDDAQGCVDTHNLGSHR